MDVILKVELFLSLEINVTRNQKRLILLKLQIISKKEDMNIMLLLLNLVIMLTMYFYFKNLKGFRKTFF